MAYAAVASLKHTTLLSCERITFTPLQWNEFNSTLSTLQKLDGRRYRGIDRSEIHELEAKITDAAWKLQDVIESYQISQGVDDEGVEQEIHSYLKTTEKLRNEYKRVLKNSCVVFAEEDDIIHHAANSTTVGLSDLSEEIITGLLDDESECKRYTIWGMAGIGKTHLARDIYHHPLIVQRFDLRLWVTIGPNHKDVEKIYVDVLAQIEPKHRDLFKEKDQHELRDLLHNSLLHRTYLIVFDDIWNASDFLQCIGGLPYYDNGRNTILTTTRLINKYDDQWYDKIWQMPFLSDEESWNLLSKNVFGGKPFPTQLEKPGRKIAEICEGLPLLIIAVADILCGLDETEECWNKVAEKKTSTFPDAYDRIYKVLVSSYDYLPTKTKACFLYMGVFRQSHEISASNLITMLMVEGFNFSGDFQMLESVVSSSLALVCKHSSYHNIKSCKLHSVYWYVCVTEAKKNRLFHVLIKLTDVFIESPRRLSIQNNMLFGLKEVYNSMAATTSLTRSLLFTGEDHRYPVKICFNTMLLLKVLDALAIRFYEFPDEVSNLLLLRYLALTHNGEVPSSISKLQFLEVLILRHHHNIKLVPRESTTYLPKEIWDLQNLECLRIMGSKLLDPIHGKKLPNLLRLYVNADSCTEGVLKGAPTLYKLGIGIELQPEGGIESSLKCLEHTGILNALDSLKCVVMNPRLSSQVVDHLSNLPQSMRMLSLNGLGYPWKFMRAIGSLPNLEVLKLQCSAFQGAEWEINDGEFLKLKYLLLEDIDVAHWIVKGSLPLLSDLTIRHCYKLKVIPYSHIPKMDRIELDECSPSLVEFAQQIKDNSSYSHLKVEINSSWNL